MAPEARPLRILIVDDSPDAASVLALMLRADGHEVRTAGDGPTAIRDAQASPSDVVVCDISMPGMDGYEVARRLRATTGRAAMTLIAMTGYGQDDDRDRSRAAGFDYHLVKPVDPTELERILERIARA